MTSRHLPRRAVVGGILAASLVGAGVAAFAADPPPPCTGPPTYTDPAGDSGVGDPATGPVTGDDDLDIVAVTQSVDDGVFSTRIKLVKLDATGPASAFADRFTSTFTVAKKAVVATMERDFSGLPGASKKATATVGGTAVTFPVTLIEDIKGSTIGASMLAADLEKAVGAPLAGEPFTAMSAAAKYLVPTNAQGAGVLNPVADTATAPATAMYAFGGSCSGGSAAPAPAASSSTTSSASPAPSSSGSPKPSSSASPPSNAGGGGLEVSAPARVQTSDREPVTATLTDSTGKPMSGKRVTAQVGRGSSVAGTTDASGQVKLSPVVVDAAGTRAVVVRYAGDAAGAGKAETRKNITVVTEVSKIATSSTGSGDVRTFAITLTDDDATRHPYAGAQLTLHYSGRSGTVTTDRDGRATLQLQSGTHVDIRYSGKPGYVAVGTARTVV